MAGYAVYTFLLILRGSKVLILDDIPIFAMGDPGGHRLARGFPNRGGPLRKRLSLLEVLPPTRKILSPSILALLRWMWQKICISDTDLGFTMIIGVHSMIIGVHSHINFLYLSRETFRPAPPLAPLPCQLTYWVNRGTCYTG